MKQTALDWLINQFLEANIEITYENMYIKLPVKALQQAKQMEKEQIIAAFYEGSGNESEEHGIDAVLDLTDAERFYNLHYGGQDE